MTRVSSKQRAASASSKSSRHHAITPSRHQATHIICPDRCPPADSPLRFAISAPFPLHPVYHSSSCACNRKQPLSDNKNWTSLDQNWPKLEIGPHPRVELRRRVCCHSLRQKHRSESQSCGLTSGKRCSAVGRQLSSPCSSPSTTAGRQPGMRARSTPAALAAASLVGGCDGE